MMEVIITGLTTIVATYIGVRIIRPAIESKITTDIVSDNLKSKQKQDAEVRKYCREVIRSIEDSGELDKDHTFATNELIENTLKVSRNYAYLSAGASEGVATYCFLFERVCSTLEKQLQNKLSYEELLNFIYLFSLDLLQLSSTYFSHPRKFKAQNHIPVKSKYKGFFSNSSLAIIPGLSNNIELSQSSYHLITFYKNYLHKGPLKRHPDFYLTFFSLMKNNDFLLLFTYLSNIYIPLKISEDFSKTSSILGGFYNLHLIYFKLKNTQNSQGHKKYKIEAIYSNIDSMVTMVFKSVSNIKSMFINDFLFSGDELDKVFSPEVQIEKLGSSDSLIKITFERPICENLFSKYKGKIEDTLILNTDKNYLLEKLKFFFVNWAEKYPRIASSLNLPRDK